MPLGSPPLRNRFNRAHETDESLLHFFAYSGVVQLVARQPLELVILVRVQAPEPSLLFAYCGILRDDVRARENVFLARNRVGCIFVP